MRVNRPQKSVLSFTSLGEVGNVECRKSRSGLTSCDTPRGGGGGTSAAAFFFKGENLGPVYDTTINMTYSLYAGGRGCLRWPWGKEEGVQTAPASSRDRIERKERGRRL